MVVAAPPQGHVTKADASTQTETWVRPIRESGPHRLTLRAHISPEHWVRVGELGANVVADDGCPTQVDKWRNKFIAKANQSPER